MVSDVYNTTVNVNGNKEFSSTYYPGYCCCGSGMYMNSCFGYGFGGIGSGLGFGLGYAAGVSLIPLMPNIINGVWSGMKWVGNTVAKGACAVAKGVKNLWNNIFHKKSKTKSEESQKA